MNESTTERSPPPWDGEFLEAMRRVGDEPADRVIEAAFRRHEVEAVHRIILGLIREEGVPTDPFEQLDPEVQTRLDRYLTLSGQLPSWAEPSKIRDGQRLFEEYGLIAFSLLGCLSLPELYACGRGGTQVLGRTLQLEEHVRRRIYETSQMVIDVMTPGGLDPEAHARGIGAVQNVRLMHAAIRHLILRDPEPDGPGRPKPSSEGRPGEKSGGGEGNRPRHFGDVLAAYAWDEAAWGVPIGQEYLAVTLHTFSSLILRGLRRFGVRISSERAENYLHAWNVVGYVLGIDERFLVNVTTMEEAERLYEAIMARNRSRDVEEAKIGRDLTEALMEFMGEAVEEQSEVARIFGLRDAPRLLAYEVLPAETVRLLGLTPSWRERIGLLPVRLFMYLEGELEHYASRHHRLADWIFRRMAAHFAAISRGGTRPPFRIPEELASAWQLKEAG